MSNLVKVLKSKQKEEKILFVRKNNHPILHHLSHNLLVIFIVVSSSRCKEGIMSRHGDISSSADTVGKYKKLAGRKIYNVQKGRS